MVDPDEEGPEETRPAFRGLRLFPFQRRAIEAIFAGKNVVVAAPTGAGKTLVADYAIERAVSKGRRAVYTSPIKALSNQKFRDFRAHYGEATVGIMTGDVTIQPEAPVLVMTTEIFRNTIFEDPERLAGFDFAVFDEVHYLDDPERGTVWEEAIIYAPEHIRIVALSATVPNVRSFADWIAEVRGTPVETIEESRRPVPLVHRLWVPRRGPKTIDEVKRVLREPGARERGGRERPGGRGRGRRAREEERDRGLGHLLDHLEERRLLPAIVFCFNRADCERLARDEARRALLSPEERARMLDLFDDFAGRYGVTGSPDTRALRELASRGILHHHAGMLPIDKEIVERLFTTGLVKVLFATETFALGVNMPARSVCFRSLAKFDGIEERPLLAREYWQMAGRAGRQGIDERGTVFALFDEREVTAWHLERYQSGRTEPVKSRFNLNYGGILNLRRRLGNRVEEAWEKSFARFQKARPAGKPTRDGLGARRIRARLAVLAELDYLDAQGRLTRKGELCARVNGYEIAVTEAYEGGWLFRCDAVQAAMLFAAIVYDPRPMDRSAPATRSLKGIQTPFAARMQAVAATEAALGAAPPTRGPCFDLSGPVQWWAEGEDFEYVLSKTTLAPGDLVRVLRMTIQMLRQAEHALAREDPVARTLREARQRIDRGVVDARRQLELG
jgi:superfamily II RNA helicase